MSNDERPGALPLSGEEAAAIARTHLVKNDPAIQKCLTDLALAAERLESMGIPAWVVEQVFTAELRESRFGKMARGSLGVE